MRSIILASVVGATVCATAGAEDKIDQVLRASFNVTEVLAELNVQARNCKLPMDYAYVGKSALLLALSDAPYIGRLREMDTLIEGHIARIRRERDGECREGDENGYPDLMDRFKFHMDNLEGIVANERDR